MNRVILAHLAFATLICGTAHAARSPGQQGALEGATFASLTIAGTVAAGPVGLILGALGGAFLADQSRQANGAELAKAEATRERAQLQTALAERQARIGELAETAATQLTFQILFATGSDILTEVDLQRVRTLADHLLRHPELKVTLDGHTDSRGTDEYNNVLSQERAKAVKDALESLGVTADRIIHQGHGNQFSTAAQRDEAACSLERRVDITLTGPPAATYAQF